MQFRQIEIDIEVHKAIEGARVSFDESPNDILRRKLLDQSVSRSSTSSQLPSSPSQSNAMWVWSRGGERCTLPAGSELRGIYSGQKVAGRIENGKLMIEGRPFDSPSEAAINLFRTKGGKQTNLNGWSIFEYKMPGELAWRSFKSLRV